ncbi:MAG: hypothetical protein M0P00_10935 [Bacteroidaceae bacterium]|nr:hypothetical protein [Bacteroidaceae bacterium]
MEDNIMNVEIAEAIKNVDLFEMAAKTQNCPKALTEDEKAVAEHLDGYFRKIGETGHDPDHEIAAFINKAVNTEIHDTPDELLDRLFDRGTIGEFDDFNLILDPKNTLVAYEAAKGGVVPKSWLDIPAVTPTTINYSITTDLSFADLRKSGWKNIARVTDYSGKALKNKMFSKLFDVIDSGLSSGDNVIAEATAAPTATSAGKLASYINDMGGGVIVGLSKYIVAISQLTGYVSESMMNELYRTGMLGKYLGCDLYPISSQKKLGDGTNQIKDKKLFGIAGKIGVLDMKGDVHTYQESDVHNDKINIYVKDFSFSYAFNKTSLDNVAKVTMAL